MQAALANNPVEKHRDAPRFAAELTRVVTEVSEWKNTLFRALIDASAYVACEVN